MFFIPPDTASHTEWWLVLFLFNSMLGIGSGWGLVMFILAILLLTLWGLLQLTIVTLKRLWEIHQEWATMNTTNGKILKGASTTLLILWLSAAWLALAPGKGVRAFLLFSASLFAFTITSEIVAWLEEQKEAHEVAALPDGISLADVISWKDEIEDAEITMEMDE